MGWRTCPYIPVVISLFSLMPLSIRDIVVADSHVIAPIAIMNIPIIVNGQFIEFFVK